MVDSNILTGTPFTYNGEDGICVAMDGDLRSEQNTIRVLSGFS